MSFELIAPPFLRGILKILASFTRPSETDLIRIEQPGIETVYLYATVYEESAASGECLAIIGRNVVARRVAEDACAVSS